MKEFIVRTLSFNKTILVLLFFVFFNLSCVGVKDNMGRVVGYKPGRVLTKKSFYEVGPLSADWKRVKLGSYQSLVFRNSILQSTLMTDAFCEGAYEDAGLKTLTRHLYLDLAHSKIIHEEKIKLSGREAYHALAEGEVDGINVKLETVVIKKDLCLFDFALISPPTQHETASKDFEKFFMGFQFEGNL